MGTFFLFAFFSSISLFALLDMATGVITVKDGLVVIVSLVICALIILGVVKVISRIWTNYSERREYKMVLKKVVMPMLYGGPHPDDVCVMIVGKNYR